MLAGKFITTALLLAVVSAGAAQDANQLPTLKRRMLKPDASIDAKKNDGHIDDVNSHGHRILQQTCDGMGKKECDRTDGCDWESTSTTTGICSGTPAIPPLEQASHEGNDVGSMSMAPEPEAAAQTNDIAENIDATPATDTSMEDDDTPSPTPLGSEDECASSKSAKMFKSKKDASMSYSKSGKSSLSYDTEYSTHEQARSYKGDAYEGYNSYRYQSRKGDKGSSMSYTGKSGKDSSMSMSLGSKSAKCKSSKVGGKSGKMGKDHKLDENEAMALSYMERMRINDAGGRVWYSSVVVVVGCIVLGAVVWT